MIGADWRIPLDEAWLRIGHDRAIQGNLDPTLLLAPLDRMLAGADDVLEGPTAARAISSTWATAFFLPRPSNTCRHSRITCTAPLRMPEPTHTAGRLTTPRVSMSHRRGRSFRSLGRL